MKVTCALSESQIEKLYAHAYGTMYKFLAASKEDKPSFDTKAYMLDLFDKIAEKEDVATAAKFIQFLPTILIQAKTKLRNLKVDLNALDALSDDFTDPKTGLDNVIKEFRPQESADLKKATIEQREKEAGNIILNDPDGKVYIPEPVLRPFSAFTSTFIQFEAKSPEDKELFTKEVIDESKKRIYSTIEKIKEENPDFETAYDDVRLNGRVIKLKAQKLTDLDPTQLDSYTQRLISRSSFMKATGKGPQDIIEADETVVLVITDENGNELFFDENGELTTRDKGKLVYQFLRGVSKTGSRYSVTNRYGYEQMQTPAMIAKATGMTEEEADAMQQKDFEELYNFKESALKKPVVIDFVGLSKGVSNEISGRKTMSFEQLAKTQYGTAKAFSSITLAKESIGGVEKGWGLITVNGQEFPFDRPLMLDDLINKIAAVMTNPKLTVDERANFVNQFLTNDLTNSAKRHELIYDRSKKEFTFKYNLYTLSERAKNGRNEKGVPIELFDISKTTKEQLDQYKATIIDVLTRASSNKDNSKFYPVRLNIDETALNNKQFRDYNVETGEFVDEQNYLDLLIKHNPWITINDDSRPAFSNSYMQFRLPSTYTQEVKEAKEAVEKAETMSAIRKYKNKVVDQILNSPNEVIEGQVSLVNIGDPATVSEGFKPARNMMITNLEDGQTARVYFIEDIFDKKDLQPKTGDTIYLTVDEDNAVRVANADGVIIGALQEADFAAGETPIEYKPKAQTQEQKSEADVKQGITPVDTTAPDDEDLGFFDRSGKLSNNVTPEEIERAEKWVKEHPIFVGKNKISFPQLVNIVNSDSYARFVIAGKNLIDAKILLNAEKGGNMVDVYHESWHAFSQLYLTKDQKTKLYNELRKSKPEYKDKSFLELEEILAEDFRSYALKESVKANRPTRNSLFRRILNWLRNLFARPTTVDRMFRDLYFAGKSFKNREQFLNKYTPLIDNVMFDLLNRGAEQVGNKKKEALNRKDSDQFVESMDSLISELVDLDYTNKKKKAALQNDADLESKSGVIKIMKDKRNRTILYQHVKTRMEKKLKSYRESLGQITKVPFDSLSTQEDLAKTAYAVYTTKTGEKKYVFLTSQVDSFDNLTLATKDGTRIKGETYNGVQIVSDFYDHKTINDTTGRPVEIIISNSPDEVAVQYENFAKVEDTYETLVQNELPEITELTDEQQILLNQIRILQSGLNNWGDATEGMVKYHVDNSRYDIIRSKPEEIEDDSDPEVIKESARTGYNKDTGKQSLEQMASKETLYILSSLHKVDKNGNYESDALGFRKLAPFRSVWNNTARTIGGVKDPEEQFKRLKVAAATFPEFNQLVEFKLPNPLSPKNRNENAITTAFFQDFGRKTLLDILQLTIFDDGVAEVVEAEMDVSSVIRDFRGRFSEDTENKYVTRVNNISLLNLNQIVDAFTDKKNQTFNAKKSLEFARAIGIYLDENETINNELTANQKAIEYYGLPFIYDIIKKMALQELDRKNLSNQVREFITGFKKDPVKYLMEGIPAGIIGKTEISEKTQVQRLASLQARYGEQYSNFSSVNAERNTIYRFINDHSISLVVDGLNNATKLSDFWTTDRLMYMSYMNPAINPFTNRLRTIKNLFENNAERTKRENKSITLALVSGTQPKDQEGANTTSLDYYSKNLQELHMMLKGGLQEFIRTAAKSSSFGTRIEGGIIDPTGAKKNDTRLWIDIDRFANGTAEDYAFQYHFLDYIAGEYDRIVTFKNNKELFKMYRGYNRKVGGTKENPIYAGETFMAFDKVLKATTKEEIFNKVGNQKLDDYLKTDPKLRQQIFDDVTNYFKEQTDRNLDTLRKANYISNDLYNQLAVFDLTNDQIEETLVKAYTYNSWIQHFETVIMFFGDPAQVDHAKEEQHKRNTGGTSNGAGFRTDKGARAYINEIASKESYAAKLEAENPGKGYNNWNYNGRFNTAIMQDVIRTSIYAPIITEALRKDNLERLSKITDKKVLLSRFSKEQRSKIKADASITEIRETLAKTLAEEDAKSYMGMEEGDGQGYITFDAYKYLKELENDWSDEQNDLYKKIVKGDLVETADMLRLFPPYKVQYYGHLHDTMLPVTAMHKFEVTPLIPPVIQGSQLQSLHEQMLRSGIQYATFQTGSKLGSVTSQLNEDGEAVADQIYQDKDYKVFKDDIKFTKNIIYLEYLKKVTSMPDEYKDSVVFSTQMRALVLDGLYENGEVIRPEYQELADNYLAAVDNYSKLLRYKLEQEIGYKKVDGVASVDMTKFMKLLQRELRRSDVPEHLINFIGVNPDNTLKFDLSFHPNADMIEKMITTLVEKRLIKQKVKGEGLLQVASSMTNGIWDTSLKRATQEEILKFIGTNNLPFYHPGPDGKTRAQKVAIALQGDFVNLLNLEYKGEKIATRERLNQAIKDDEWLDANNGRNRKAVTLTGVRIPVDSYAQLDFMEVYEFLDPSASNIIIMASEMVAKSGGDYDGDKLTTSFPHISKKGNFILRKRSNEELSKEIEELKNSKDKNKNAEAKQLIELQEKVLQNELISTVRAILEAEGNYANLVRPNTVDRLKDISKELKPFVSEFNILERAHGEPQGSTMSPTNIFEAGYNLHKHQVNLDSARPLGITAVENKLGAVFNSIGYAMPATYKFSYYSPNLEKWVQTDREYKMRLFLPHNSVKINGQNRISLSNINSSDFLDVITVLNSKLLNGFLDVEKDDWVAYIQGNLEVVPVFIYLLKAGVPVRDAIYFVSNPMVRDYAKQQRLIKSKYNKLIGTKPDKPQYANYNASVKTLMNFGILPNEEGQYTQNKLVTNKTYYQAVTKAVSDPNILEDGVFSREDMLDVIENPNQNEDKMLAMYLHFLEIEKQIKGVSALKRQLNPDTSRDKTIQEVIRRESAFEDLDANSKIDQVAKQTAREKSILSSFFQRDLIIDMVEPVFKFRNNKKINDFLFDMINLQSGRITKKYGQGRDGIAKFITDFKNAVASSLYQNNIGPLYDPEGNEIDFESMLGSDLDSFNTKFFDLMKELPESLKLQYSILTQLRPENVKDKRIITLNNRKNVKGDLATTYYQELKALSNPSISKVTDPIMNQYISQMFDLFTLVSVYQNGMGYSDYGFIQSIPFDEIAVIMQKNSKEYLDKLDPAELNRIANILLSKDKFKNYGPAGTQSLETDDITQGPQAPVTLPDSEIPDMPEDTRPVTQEDIAQGRTISKRILGSKQEQPSSSFSENIKKFVNSIYPNWVNNKNNEIKLVSEFKSLQILPGEESPLSDRIKYGKEAEKLLQEIQKGKNPFEGVTADSQIPNLLYTAISGRLAQDGVSELDMFDNLFGTQPSANLIPKNKYTIKSYTNEPKKGTFHTIKRTGKGFIEYKVIDVSEKGILVRNEETQKEKLFTEDEYFKTFNVSKDAGFSILGEFGLAEVYRFTELKNGQPVYSLEINLYDESNEGKGLGKDIYKAAIQEINKRGGVLTPGNVVKGNKIWESFERDGLLRNEVTREGDVIVVIGSSTTQPTVQPVGEVKPATEKTIVYTPKGKEKQTYTIRGNKIFNKNGEEVFKEASVDRTKIFANLAIKEGRAVIVEHKGDKYVVNNKDQIVSVKTGRLLQWREDNGDRQAVLAMASAVRDQIATRPQPVSVKLIDDLDVQDFNAAVEANKNLKPNEYMIGDSKYVLNQNGFYDLVDKNTGDTYIKNVDLTTGYTEVVADEPVNEKQRKDFIKSIQDGIKNFGLEEQLAMEGIDVNKILANLEAATTQSEVIESISKILKKIC